MGNRVCKIEKPYNLTSTGWKYTFYVRDASGNIMTTYTKTGSEIENNVLKLDEVMLYGSSRIGTREVNALLSGLTIPTTTFSRALGLKRYEIGNHLGNVLATFTDRKYQIQSSNQVTGYKTYIASSQDYYPFGMIMNGRNWNTSGYRFGFNGQEKDNEIYNNESTTTALFWEYDGRIGRRWNRDSEVKPFQSDYLCFSDNPILRVDFKGNTDYINSKGEKVGSDGNTGNGRVILVTNASTIKLINKSTSFQIESLPADSYYELPPYEVRQEMKRQVSDLGDIAYKEVGGQIEQFTQYGDDNVTKIDEGIANVPWEDGPSYKSFGDRAYIKEVIDQGRNPLKDKKNTDRKTLYKWHTHPNGILDEKNRPMSYSQYKRSKMAENVNNTSFGGTESEIFKENGPSPEDFRNIFLNQIGIVIDMKNKKTYFFNSSFKNDEEKKAPSMDTPIFFDYKEGQ